MFICGGGAKTERSALFSGRSRSERRTPVSRTTTTTRGRRAARRRRRRTTSMMKSTSPSGTRTTTRTTSTRTTSSPTTTSPRTWRGTSAPSTEPDGKTKSSQRERTSRAPPPPHDHPTPTENVRTDGRRSEGRPPSPEPLPPCTAALAFPLPVFYLLCFHKVRKEMRDKKKRVLCLIFQFLEQNEAPETTILV